MASVRPSRSGSTATAERLGCRDSSTLNACTSPPLAAVFALTVDGAAVLVG